MDFVELQKKEQTNSGLVYKEAEGLTGLIYELQKQNQHLQEQSQQLIQQSSRQTSYGKLYFLLVILLLVTAVAFIIMLFNRLSLQSVEQIKKMAESSALKQEIMIAKQLRDIEKTHQKNLELLRMEEKMGYQELLERAQAAQESFETLRAAYEKELLQLKKENSHLQAQAKEEQLILKGKVEALEDKLQHKEMELLRLKNDWEESQKKLSQMKEELSEKDTRIQQLESEMVKILTPNEMIKLQEDLKDDG